VLKVNVQAPAAIVPEQLSPVLAVTVTLPEGAGRLVPVTVNLIVTNCPTTEGLGVCELIVVVLAIFVAAVD
jgi:hypothetical protein